MDTSKASSVFTVSDTSKDLSEIAKKFVKLNNERKRKTKAMDTSSNESRSSTGRGTTAAAQQHLQPLVSQTLFDSSATSQPPAGRFVGPGAHASTGIPAAAFQDAQDPNAFMSHPTNFGIGSDTQVPNAQNPAQPTPHPAATTGVPQRVDAHRMEMPDPSQWQYYQSHSGSINAQDEIIFRGYITKEFYMTRSERKPVTNSWFIGGNWNGADPIDLYSDGTTVKLKPGKSAYILMQD